MKNLFLTWLPLVIIVTIFSGLVYGSVQQVYRQDANDSQVQLAEDAASKLNSGATPSSVTPTGQVDQTSSLAPFMVVLDKNFFATYRIFPANILATNAIRAVDTGAVVLPVPTVFSNAEQNGERRFTWETAGGLRFATVVVPYKDGFVLAARNLREVEKREQRLFEMTLVAWAIGLILSMAAVLVADYWRRQS